MPFFQQMVKLFLESRLTVTIHQLAVKFSCSHTENCIIGECSECSLAKLGSDNFNTRPSSKQFPEHADKPVKGITSLHLPTENDLIEPDDIEASPRIKCTLLIHMNKRFLIGRSVSYFQYFKMATIEKPFFKQFYGEETCSHQKIAADDKQCGSCLEDHLPTTEE